MKSLALYNRVLAVMILLLGFGASCDRKTDFGGIKQSVLVWPSDIQGLKVGSADLWCSFPSKHGEVSFCMPRSSAKGWEFAPCSRSRLSEVRSRDLAGPFIGAGDPRTEALFPTKNRGWLTRRAAGLPSATGSIPVTQGQVILARLIAAPEKIYAIQFTEQTGDLDHGTLRIEYREFDATSAEPGGAPKRGQPVWPQTNRASAAAGPDG